ncbi:MAG: hypothetical protein DLM59_20790 [Pseudonocardiales bacterium]|nr:MAG: hypothetical protein DLM59_20790 [Pseudonocardiales bacterium]
MDTVTRRRFLVASGVVGAGALVAGATSRSWLDLIAAGLRDPRAADAKILVLLTMYGGNDGLGTVVPYADPAYRTARPHLAYSENEVLRLGDDLGLNPAMKGLHALWGDKKLAIIRGVGYPKPDHSHFRSMDIWQSGSPDAPVHTGWLGRWLDALPHDPLRAVSLGPVLPPLLAGSRGAGSTIPLKAGPIGRLTLPDGALRSGLSALARPAPGEPAMQAAAAVANADLFTVAGRMGSAVNGGAGAADPKRAQGELAAQLDIVARCITSGAPTRVYAVSLGGFDTHADEKDTQSRLLGEVDAAVSAFLAAVGRHPAGASVVLAAYSEFGRRVGANASDGTDHGTAGVMFVAGSPVRGGFYGEQPSLSRLDQGDLHVSTDFRSVYGELLHKVLDTEPGRVLAGSAADRPLGFL